MAYLRNSDPAQRDHMGLCVVLCRTPAQARWIKRQDTDQQQIWNTALGRRSRCIFRAPSGASHVN